MTKPIKAHLRRQHDGRSSNGHFAKGNNLAQGRPPGARNKSPAYPFTNENDTSAPARRFRALMLRMCSDLGGVEALTAGQQQLVKRCAMISVACELMEKEAIDGRPLNSIAYGTLTGHLTRTLKELGLKREPIDVAPALHEYLDTLQPAEPQDLVTVAAEDKNEG
jgi:hypothetical protein